MPFLGRTPTQLVDPEVDINGGAIDGVTIGATSASPATVTTFTSTGIDDNATSTALTIDSSENVGIGTTSLSSKVSLVASGVQGLHLGQQSDNTGNSGRLFFDNSTNIWTAYSTLGNFKIASGATIGTTSGTDRLVINSSGNVGIGTSSPTGFTGYTSLDINNATNGAIIDLSQGDAMKGRLVATSSTMAIETAASVPILFQPAGTERMRIDSSGNVGIGNSNPYTRVHITKDSDTDYTSTRFVSTEPTAIISNGTSGALNYASLSFITESNGEFAIGSVQNSGNTASDFVFVSRDSGNREERARITSNGNLLVGTTNANPTSSSVNDPGVELSNTGGVRSTVASNPAATFNRKTDDGVVALFRKDGTTVGSIGTKSGGIYIGTDDAGIFFNHHGGGDLDAVLPYDVGAGSLYNGHVDLGGSSNRFKDLYLSGGAYLGGTGAANYLDDYEEGTFTAHVKDTNDNVTYITSAATSRYVKIGSIVTAFIVVYAQGASAHTFVGTPYIEMPYTPGNNAGSYTAVNPYYLVGMGSIVSGYVFNNNGNKLYLATSDTTPFSSSAAGFAMSSGNKRFYATITYAV